MTTDSRLRFELQLLLGYGCFDVFAGGFEVLVICAASVLPVSMARAGKVLAQVLPTAVAYGVLQVSTIEQREAILASYYLGGLIAVGPLARNMIASPAYLAAR